MTSNSIVKIFIQNKKNIVQNIKNEKINNIFTITNTHNKKIKNTEEFFVYKNVIQSYCLSKKKIKNKNWKYQYNFFYNFDNINKKIPFYIDHSNKELQVKCMYPFLNKFIKKLNIPIIIDTTPIRHTQNKIHEGIYVRKETHDTKFDIKNTKIKLFIDALDDKKIKDKFEKYYHIPLVAITFYLRNPLKQSWYNLLKPLKEIYNPLKKKYFCDYMFYNTSYRNGKKRYNFFKILNRKKKVHNIKNGKRFLVKMYEEAVYTHRPYRFCISFENDIVSGWITEKIVNAFLAGCIPIYDGTEDIYKYFNKESFINAKDFKNLEELANYVIKVENDKNLYLKYINACPTNLKKLRKLFWWENISPRNPMKWSSRHR